MFEQYDSDNMQASNEFHTSMMNWWIASKAKYPVPSLNYNWQRQVHFWLLNACCRWPFKSELGSANKQNASKGSHVSSTTWGRGGRKFDKQQSSSRVGSALFTPPHTLIPWSGPPTTSVGSQRYVLMLHLQWYISRCWACPAKVGLHHVWNKLTK